MSVNEADILQIRRYLNGELDARAMYELELRAQNDAQLMDVMLGMEAAQTDHQPQIDELNQLIKQRVAPERKRIVPMYTYWAAAASILLVLGVGGWWITRQPEQTALKANNITKIAPVDKTKVDTAPTIAKIPLPVDDLPRISANKPIAKKRQSIVQVAITPLDSFMVDSGKSLIAVNQNKKLNEVVIRGYVKRAREQTTGASYVVTGKEVQDNPVGNVEQLLQGKVAGVNIQNNKNAPYNVTGKVTDKQDGSPLPGVSISLNGKAITQTDVNGAFSLSTRGENMLTVNFIGYQSKQIQIGKQRDLKIELTQATGSLAEVVVVGYTAGCKENEKFKTRFFDNVTVAEKYTLEHTNDLAYTITERKFFRALKFIARYATVSIRTDVKNGKGYPDFATFTADKEAWQQWYEANKCKNLK